MPQAAPTFLHLNLSDQSFEIKSYDELIPRVGGLGWALSLFESFQKEPASDASAPGEEPIVFAIGPLSGVFPGASKTMAVFRSPQTKGLATSLGGGHLARFLRFAGYQGIIITGEAAHPTLVSVEEEKVSFQDARSLGGLEVPKVFERVFSLEGVPSRRTVLVSGPAAEEGFAFASLYADEFFPFGRGGLGRAFAEKNLKGLVVSGTKSEKIADPRRYEEVFSSLVRRLKGYRELSRFGSLRNLTVGKKISGVPFKNLEEPNFEGNRLLAPQFMKELTVRRVSDGGSSVGSVHLFQLEKGFTYYDYEGVVSLGPLLGLMEPKAVGGLLERAWGLGLDPTSLGAILAYVTEKEALDFGNLDTYLTLLEAFVDGREDWAKTLRRGLPPEPQALTLAGMEFLPYFNGYTSILSQALRLGATTEENRGFLLDLDFLGRKKIDPEEVVMRLVEGEEKKTLAELLVGGGYFADIFEDPAVAFAALEALGISFSHEHLSTMAKDVFRQKLALQSRLGFNPPDVKIPEKFFKVPSPQGFLEKEKLEEMIRVYTDEIFQPAS